MIRFNKTYFLLATFLFLIEVLIGRYMHDALIRPYGGDFLVVILLYCMVKSIINTPVFRTACCVLVFAYLVEISQYFHLINLLGLQRSRIANLILGNYFSFTDMLVYTLGILLVIVAEKIRINLKMSFNN
ncbi:MAG: ribosomal maturation YjgA family protein [Mucilaginibacter sp.]